MSTKVVLQVKHSNMDLEEIVKLKAAIEAAGYRIKVGRYTWVVEK